MLDFTVLLLSRVKLNYLPTRKTYSGARLVAAGLKHILRFGYPNKITGTSFTDERNSLSY